MCACVCVCVRAFNLPPLVRVHALQGPTCRARVTPASSPASHCASYFFVHRCRVSYGEIIILFCWFVCVCVCACACVYVCVCVCMCVHPRMLVHSVCASTHARAYCVCIHACSCILCVHPRMLVHIVLDPPSPARTVAHPQLNAALAPLLVSFLFVNL